jgi:tRNA dimethylallyltransferase
MKMGREVVREFANLLSSLDPARPVLIAGPTASGKSALALEIARRQGGEIVNADASQVFDCWRILTARPTPGEEAEVPHHLYGHVSAREAYSTGHWLREVAAVLDSGVRPIITGGTGLYFLALTQGLAEIPATPDEVRAEGDGRSLGELILDLDAATAERIDLANRARVQRAWEVLRATGRGLADWQAQTDAPRLPLPPAQGIVFDVDREWLNDRIARRFDAMLAAGALEEARAVWPHYDPSRPAHRAIGAPELMALLQGEITRDAARDRVVIATRQFAKRQRTWFRSKMQGWTRYRPQHLD